MNDSEASSSSNNPWESPKLDPVNGVVHPRIVPPEGKPTRHTNRLEYILNTVLKEAAKHKHAWPFMKPVDTFKLGIPDYHKVIRRPMDLKTIELRIKNKYYSNAAECLTDIDQVFVNCYTYNSPGLEVWSCAKELEKSVHALLTHIFFAGDDVKTVFANCYSYNGSEDDITIMAQNVEAQINELVNDIPKEEIDIELHKKKKKSSTAPRLVAGADTRKKDRARSMSEDTEEGDVKKAVKRKADDSSDDGFVAKIPPRKPELASKVLPVGKSVVAKKKSMVLTGRLKGCLKILNDLAAKKFSDVAWPFYDPVDVEGLRLLDYNTIVKKPMDMSTIRKKLETGQYDEAEEFGADFRLMLDNCFLYNPAHTMVAECGRKLLSAFEQKWLELPQEKETPTVHVVKKEEPAAQEKAEKHEKRESKEREKERGKEHQRFSEDGAKKLDSCLTMLHDTEMELQSRLQECQSLIVKVTSARKGITEATEKKKPLPSVADLVDVVEKTCAGQRVGVGPLSNSRGKRTSSVNSQKDDEYGNHTTTTFYEFRPDSDEAKRTMTHDEQRTLSLSLNEMNNTQLFTVVRIVQQRENWSAERSSNEMEIDFEKLKTTTLRELQAFARQALGSKYDELGNMPRLPRANPVAGPGGRSKSGKKNKSFKSVDEKEEHQTNEKTSGTKGQASLQTPNVGEQCLANVEGNEVNDQSTRTNLNSNTKRNRREPTETPKADPEKKRRSGRSVGIESRRTEGKGRSERTAKETHEKLPTAKVNSVIVDDGITEDLHDAAIKSDADLAMSESSDSEVERNGNGNGNVSDGDTSSDSSGSTTSSGSEADDDDYEVKRRIKKGEAHGDRRLSETFAKPPSSSAGKQTNGEPAKGAVEPKKSLVNRTASKPSGRMLSTCDVNGKGSKNNVSNGKTRPSTGTNEKRRTVTANKPKQLPASNSASVSILDTLLPESSGPELKTSSDSAKPSAPVQKSRSSAHITDEIIQPPTSLPIPDVVGSAKEQTAFTADVQANFSLPLGIVSPMDGESAESEAIRISLMRQEDMRRQAEEEKEEFSVVMQMELMAKFEDENTNEID